MQAVVLLLVVVAFDFFESFDEKTTIVDEEEARIPTHLVPKIDLLPSWCCRNFAYGSMIQLVFPMYI